MTKRDTSTMTRDQREAVREMKQEHRQLMRSLAQAIRSMGLGEQTALVVFARELAQPGTLHEMLCDYSDGRVAGRLGLG